MSKAIYLILLSIYLLDFGMSMKNESGTQILVKSTIIAISTALSMASAATFILQSL